jgi:hypothetical protein
LSQRRIGCSCLKSREKSWWCWQGRPSICSFLGREPEHKLRKHFTRWFRPRSCRCLSSSTRTSRCA